MSAKPQSKPTLAIILALLVGATVSMGALVLTTGHISYNGHVISMQNNTGIVCLKNQTDVCGKGNITNTQTTLNSISINSLNRTTFTGVLANQTLTEGTYTNWTRIVNKNVTGSTSSGVGDYVVINNNGTLLMQSAFGTNFIFSNDGTEIVNMTNSSPATAVEHIYESSLSGLYQILLNQTGSTVLVYKNNSLLTKLDIGSTSFNSDCGISISPNGKYIGISGANIDNSAELIQIWQGS